jgi:uncharacterized protein
MYCERGDGSFDAPAKSYASPEPEAFGGRANGEEMAVVHRGVAAGAPVEVYRRYLEGGTLGFQRCWDCSSTVFYPRVLCPVCGSTSLEWRTSGGRGVVYATTAVHRRDGEPYNVALVDLEEGFRMMSRVEGVPAEEVGIGLRVWFEVREEDDGPVAVFVPAEPSG